MADPLDLDSPLEFREAVESFRRRVPMTRAEWEALVAAARERAFMVSNVAQVDVIQQVFDAVASAITNGDTLEDFKRTVGPALEASWSGTVANPAARLETIFRTNVQTAYAAGHAEQRDNPVIKRRRPFNQYRAINDARTSAICRPLNGVVRAADDPWWADNSPPRHFNCRCRIVPLTEAQAQAAGVTASLDGLPPAQSGFGTKPSLTNWTPEKAGYSPELWAEVEKKLKRSP